MEHKSNGSFYYIIPSEVMHDKNLGLEEKVLYALISGLSNKHGYCFASNEWFEQEMGLKEKCLQRHLKKLEDLQYISRKIVSYDDNPFKKQRHIYINANFKKSLPGVKNDALETVDSDALEASKMTGIISEEKINKRIISKEGKSAPPPPSADAADLCNFFIEKIKERNPKFKEPKTGAWAEEFAHLLKLDERDVKETRAIIEWIHTHSFWKANCLSPSSLRKHYDKMVMQMQADQEQNQVEDNRHYVLAMKKTFPDRLKDLTISPKYAMNVKTCKEVPFSLPKESFKSAFLNMFGGKYEPNRAIGNPGNEVEPDTGD